MPILVSYIYAMSVDGVQYLPECLNFILSLVTNMETSSLSVYVRVISYVLLIPGFRFMPPIETHWFEVSVAPVCGPPAKIRRKPGNVLEVWLELPTKVSVCVCVCMCVFENQSPVILYVAAQKMHYRL